MMTNANFSNFGPILEYLKSVPYDVFRTQLYSIADLYKGYDLKQPDSFEGCYDKQVFNHFISTKKLTNNVNESIARTLHDQWIYVALGEFIRVHDYRKCIGVMGGHALIRTDAMYRQIAFISKRLTEEGFYMLSGGGPGAMEATHLGAWMAGRNDDDMEDALRILSAVPTLKNSYTIAWLSTAFEVICKYPQSKYESVGIPTWLYGHEPSTPFATHIAKFFENSIRENLVLTLPFGGIIYTPGSAGTLQEVFQDAVQNHYQSYGFSSPMIFLGSHFWTEKIPVYPLIEELKKKGLYENLYTTLTDDSDTVLLEINKFQDIIKDLPNDFNI